MSKPWQPILRGDLARKAEAVIATIARTLGHAERSFRPKRPYWHDAAPAQLALFFGYLAAATRRAEHKERAARFLELGVQLFSAKGGLALYGGLCELAWTIRHLQGPPVRLNLDAGELLESVDDRLLGALKMSSWKGEYDLISGLVGYGVYALSRLPGKKAVTALKRIVAHLDALAERSADGLAWFTAPQALPKHQRTDAPKGYYNLGVAHGLPGVVGLLAEMYRRGIERRRTRQLLEGAVSSMLAQKLPAGSSLLLPAWVAPGKEPQSCRVAWCYGDLGASLTLLNAARVCGREDWGREALTLAWAAACRPFLGSDTKDACLCHGAAGNGHLFNRLLQATGETGFREAADLYFRKTLELRGRPPRLGGYSFWTPPLGSMKVGWNVNASFLSGLAGVGLALLAATCSVEPRWDEILLARVRPASNLSLPRPRNDPEADGLRRHVTS
jgi:lantibiotic biosynthesis protein